MAQPKPIRRFRPVRPGANSAWALVLVSALLGGCASVAPEYSPSNDNARILSSKPGKGVGAGDFRNGGKDPEGLDRLTIRGGSFTSPYDGSYAAYLREALRMELQAAGRWKPDSAVRISGELLDNQLDASGISIGTARVSARFVVLNGGVSRYEKVITVDHEWESAFAGPIAIPRARENYVVTIQRVIGKLLADEDFQKAIQ